MPVCGSQEKGDLFVRFDVQFGCLSVEQKAKIVAALQQNEAEL